MQNKSKHKHGSCLHCDTALLNRKETDGFDSFNSEYSFILAEQANLGI